MEWIKEFTAAGGKVDRSAGIIRNAMILGMTSRNGRVYPEATIRQALGLYEGAIVNVNHPKGSGGSPRDYEHRLGFFRGVSFRPGQGAFGDLHYNPKHAVAESLAWWAEHEPRAVGFSHNIEAHTSRKDGKVVVENIVRVQSVDLVADPATTNGIFEHQEQRRELTDHRTLVEVLKGVPLIDPERHAELVALLRSGR